jgi:TRAP-type C4-dicarboxylate transport system permease small subunit
MIKIFKAIDYLLGVLLAGMVIMVFGNVVLRYFFNSGILVSEELSRYFFVWIVFIGAISVSRERGHLGLDSIVRKLPKSGKKICGLLTHALVILSCALIFDGTLSQHEISATTTAPITEMKMIWVYGVTYITTIGIGLIRTIRFIRLVMNFDADDLAAPTIAE